MSLIDLFRNGTEIKGDDECWLWKKAKYTDGYGHIRFKNKDYATHRLSYELFKGEIPLEKCVLHICDNRDCNNPNHLYLGDRLENCHDMIRKGRHPNQKNMLTTDNIKEIKRLRFEEKKKLREIAEIFSVSLYYIGTITTGKRRALS
jgi:hypothetical protein